MVQKYNADLTVGIDNKGKSPNKLDRTFMVAPMMDWTDRRELSPLLKGL